MSNEACVWIGADPGGNGNFGLAILSADGSKRAWCVNCADEAVQIVVQQVHFTPSGVGVDAPLWWSSGLSSDRQADQWLRQQFGLPSGTVQPANCLRGAALVQGVMFVQRIRQSFPDVPITEAHPKALLKALQITEWNTFASRFDLTALSASTGTTAVESRAGRQRAD